MVPSQRDHECGLASRRDAGAVVVSADGLHQVWIDRGGGAAGLVATHPLKAPSAGIEAVIDGSRNGARGRRASNPAAGGGGVCGRCCHGRSLRSVPSAGRVNTPGVDWFPPDHPRAVLEGGPRPDSGPVPGRASWHNKHKEAPAGSLELTDLDVLPEPEPVGDLLHRRTRRFVEAARAWRAPSITTS